MFLILYEILWIIYGTTKNILNIINPDQKEELWTFSPLIFVNDLFHNSSFIKSWFLEPKKIINLLFMIELYL